MARLTDANVQRARSLIGLYPKARSALIPLLHIVQEQDGHLSEDGMAHAAELVGLEPAEVLGTASFYDMFKTEPVGRYVMGVCTNIACLLLGGYELLEHAEDRLGVKVGGTTPDGQFTLEDVECIAACDRAPCLQVNYRYFGPLTDKQFDDLVDDLDDGRLEAEVPAHGTLVREPRRVGLLVPLDQVMAERKAMDEAVAARKAEQDARTKAEEESKAQAAEQPSPTAAANDTAKGAADRASHAQTDGAGPGGGDSRAESSREYEHAPPASPEAEGASEGAAAGSSAPAAAEVGNTPTTGTTGSTADHPEEPAT